MCVRVSVCVRACVCAALFVMNKHKYFLHKDDIKMFLGSYINTETVSQKRFVLNINTQN